MPRAAAPIGGDPAKTTQACVPGRRRRGGPPVPDEEITRVLDAVRRSRGSLVDGYSTDFVRGVIGSAISREGVEDVRAFVDRLTVDRDCEERFLSSLWIGTTSFFRDPIAFHAIRRELGARLRAGQYPRIWVAGCSTGEEVYSLAIVLRDEGVLDRCRIYATDVNVRALDTARRGVYPSSTIREGTPRYHASGGRGSLCELYTSAGRGVTFDPSLRANVTFAVHDLGSDGRFQEFDLILCRNVLIWFGPKMRDRTLALLRASLKPDGTLVLGRRENPNDASAEPVFERVAGGTPLWRFAPGAGSAAMTAPPR
jgi:chemotaxis protein methyltransferase CheR